MELTTNGKNPLKLSNGEQRGFLEDGDELNMSANCVSKHG
jgi:fumarylacetoacetase